MECFGFSSDVAPINWERVYEKEIFDVWYSRVKYAMPNVPRNVAKQWLWRHWGFSDINHYDVRKLIFRISIISLRDVPKIRQRIRDYSSVLTYGAGQLDESIIHLKEGGWLPRVMLNRCTWPIPPIVFDNTSGHLCEDVNVDNKSLVVLEGHRRTSILNHLATVNKALPEHRVWIASM
jgi:hypothetical protein